jgi:SRSO17 transposase
VVERRNPAIKKNDTAAFREAARCFMDFCERYSHHFVQQGMNSVGHARHYLGGLLGTQRRKNIETIHLDVAHSDYQGMEQFISSSPWCHRALMDQIAGEADALLGDEADTGLFIDESSFLKKGSASVGVQRQWSGRAGKIENCQVGVFACLGRGEQMAITDFRLYLPQSWVDEPDRCDKAKVPEDQRAYQAKWQQALDMVRHARTLKLRHGWVGVDSLYGSNARFLNELEDMGEKFMADVSKVTKVWTSKPRLETAGGTGPKNGRPRKHPKLKEDNRARYLSVEELMADRFAKGSVELSYRQGHKGKQCTRFWAGAVWCWEKDWAQPRKRMLVVRKEADESFKYSLSNVLGEVPWERYAWMQGQRFWMEHAFHEAKSQLGMAQYQVRVWRGWHHHMSLVCLALLLSTRLKQQTQETAPLLSTRDITELLDFYLPRKGLTEEEVIAQIRQRHRQRQTDIDRRRNHRLGLPKL